MEKNLDVEMKEIEHKFRFFLDKKSYTILRIDGKKFSNYTKNLDKPFDEAFIEDMNLTAIELCKSIQGAKFGFVQSDEISILTTSFESPETEMWFGGNLQKIVSVSASIATAEFNKLRTQKNIMNHFKEEIISDLIYFSDGFTVANFDSRAFQMDARHDVMRYFVWRQLDGIRNSVSSSARVLYSTKELEKKSHHDKIQMMLDKEVDWTKYPLGFRQGRIIVKEEFMKEGTLRHKWIYKDAPDFIKTEPLIQNFLLNNVPIKV